MSEVDTYKIFRELEAREKRANPYKFYDKDELIDEILKDEDEIEILNNKVEEVREYIKQTGQYLEDIKRFKVDVLEPNYLDILEILDKGE